MNKEEIYLKASFWTRLAAFIIDQIIITILLFIIIFTLTLAGFKTDTLGNILYYTISIVYGSVFIWKYGATLGKKWLKLRVVNTSYQSVSLGKAILRESVGKFISSLVFSYGYLASLVDKQRQTWHDKIAKTYVVVLTPQGKMIPITDEIVIRKNKITFWILYLTAGFPIVALSIFVIVYLFVVQPNVIKGKSMNPNYYDGEYYLTSKMAYRITNPQRGDVIIFVAPNNPNVDYIERVIALPGETVEIIGGKILVNGNLLDEPYLVQGTETLPEKFLSENIKVTVPLNRYFTLGDNRSYSLDSRDFGFLPREKIVGKVTICYWNCRNPSFLEKLFNKSDSSK